MIKIDAVTIGKNITARREQLNMSIEYLAQKTGITLKRIKQIEAGEKRPNIAPLARIAWALEITIEELLTVEQTTATKVLYNIAQSHEKSTEE
ncbi:Helix-turn-helix protein [Desulfitobacterium dehalogenans ATCC 51507]|uniref:Helix-turn-helix protein n=1 Tax=Desulfitobacterium dehalogenans (strain ATCC 51507 / DSM 9161 / JW/IU-DC1) TaxID=756499 RepID=I4A6G5_DESDJ|nr:helix-turn-helix transcriptional regulator [Desulfitobacterium dehalogenans]AFL99549.1 Helix-turn-helix protein [Desulfitobacterium dehalogenans ATCC 51507]